MTEYRNTDGTTTRTDGGAVYGERRSHTGRIIGGLILAALIIVGILFATGFWSADVHGGSMPKVNVTAKSGSMPAVDVHSKELVVGTTQKTVDVPKVETKKETVNVPVLGVKDKQ